MQVTAVIVTHNRLELLKECITAVKAQTYQPSAILVVNNDSSDGTTEWLKKQNEILNIHQSNRGGAWGFYTGIKGAYNTGADWFWIMDDDTIPYPSTLEYLTKAVEDTNSEDNFGFFSSKVTWTDGNLHLLNKPHVDQSFSGKNSFAYYNKKGLTPLAYNSFVSIIISKEAVEKAGLPIKEFFIWNDDIEYTQRIRKNGFVGALVEKSVVVHKTPVNNESNLFTDSKTNLWKYCYGFRNDLYIRKHTKGYGSYVRNLFKRFVVFPFMIFINRKGDRWAFTKMVWRSSFDAMSFNPVKEFINQKENVDHATGEQV